MALDLLGSMGSGICELLVKLKDQVKHLDVNEPLNEVLQSIAEKTLSGAPADEQDLLFWQGPLRAVVEHLLESGQSDPSLQVGISQGQEVGVLTLYERFHATTI